VCHPGEPALLDSRGAGSDGARPGHAYKISDIALASRLSFFLWSSIPDDELLDAAEAGKLRRPEVLEAQVRRMLADPRSRSLVTNFAAQWLHLGALESIEPDARRFIDFDDNLRQGMRQETETLLREHLARRSQRDGPDLRRLHVRQRAARETLRDSVHLRQPVPTRLVAAIGAAARRAVATGKHPYRDLVCHAHLARDPRQMDSRQPARHATPPALPDVPALDGNATISAKLPVRERLAAHRASPKCASCHNLMDPVGFSLENFDAVGHWRTTRRTSRSTTRAASRMAASLPASRGSSSAAESPQTLRWRHDEKLLTFALGRGVEYYDCPVDSRDSAATPRIMDENR